MNNTFSIFSGFFVVPPEFNRPPPKDVSKATETAESSFKPDIRPYRRLSAQESRIPNIVNEETQRLYIDFLTTVKLNRQYNSYGPGKEAEQEKLLHQLLNPAYKDKQPANIKTPIYFQFGKNVTVGNNFVADVECVLLDAASITFGDNCVLGPNVHIYSAGHPVDPKSRLEYSVTYPIKIGNNVQIGGGSVVCPGVTIGDNVRVAPGSVVVKDIPSNVEIGGVPATIIRQLDK